MKALFRLTIVGLALLAVAGLVGFLSLGRFARAAVERGGTFALGVPTTLGSARIGLLSGEFGLFGLEVANPEGFEREHFLRIGSAELALSLGSLRSELVEAPRLVLEDLELSLERRDGKTNYDTILENLERLQGEQTEAKGGATSPEDDGSEQRFVIREVLLRDIVAHVDLLPAGGEWTRTSVRIPELTLENVGNDAASIADVIAQVVTALVTAVVQAGGEVIPGELLADLEAELASLTGHGLQLSDESLAELGTLASRLSKGDTDGLLEEAGKQLLEGLLKRD